MCSRRQREEGIAVAERSKRGEKENQMTIKREEKSERKGKFWMWIRSA